MQAEVQWQGLGSELRLLRAAWQDLPDNPLWLLVLRQAAAQHPQQLRQLRLFWAFGGALLLLAFAAACMVTHYWQPSAGITDYFKVLIIGFLGPCVVLYLALTLIKLALNSQLWLASLGPGAGGKFLPSALADPLLRLTPLGPREVITAALRALLPPVVLFCAVSSGVAGLTALMAAADNSSLTAALLLAPLTVAGYFVAGTLGGTALTLLLICLGLNSSSQVQRSLPAVLLLCHHLAVFPLGYASVLSYDFLGSNSNTLGPLTSVVGAVLLLGAVWLGARITQDIPRLGTTWLLATPVLFTVIFSLLVGAGQLSATVTGRDTQGIFPFLDAVVFQLVSAWSSLSLIHPTAFASGLSFGLSSGDQLVHWHQVVRFAVLLLTQCGLIAIFYRAALYATSNRLRYEI